MYVSHFLRRCFAVLIICPLRCYGKLITLPTLTCMKVTVVFSFWRWHVISACFHPKCNVVEGSDLRWLSSICLFDYSKGFLHLMPFLMQPSPLILALDWHFTWGHFDKVWSNWQPDDELKIGGSISKIHYVRALWEGIVKQNRRKCQFAAGSLWTLWFLSTGCYNEVPNDWLKLNVLQYCKKWGDCFCY